MKPKNKEFIEILTEKIVLYEQFMESLSQEKEAIKIHSLPDITSQVKRKEGLVRKLEANEEKRQEIIAYYSAKFNVPANNMTLLKLSRLIGAPFSEKILKLRSRLKKRIESVAESGRSNKELIQTCTASLGKTRTFFERLLGYQQVYSANGKASNPPSGHGRVLNSRV